MIALLFASLLALLASEYFFRLPFIPHAKAVLSIQHKAFAVIRSAKISDHWKEIVLLCYAKKLAMHTFIIALMLLGGFSLVVLPALFVDFLWVLKPSVLESFSTWLGLICMAISSSCYILLRKYSENK